MLQTKEEILDWLEKNNYYHKENLKNNAYHFIDIPSEVNEEYLKKNHYFHSIPENIMGEIVGQLKKNDIKVGLIVHGPILIAKKKINRLPFKFLISKGNFVIIHNELEDLQGFPFYCEGYVQATDNQLKSLKGSPLYIDGTLNLSSNLLQNLQDITQIITSNLICKNNKINSLVYFPEKIGGHITFLNNDELFKHGPGIYSQTSFEFWNHLHSKELSFYEESLIIDNLECHDSNHKKMKI